MKGEPNGHRRTLVKSAGDRDDSVVRFGNPLGDRQTKSGSSHCRRTASPHSIGPLDDMRKICLRDPKPVVGHHDLRFMLRGVQANDDPAVFPSVFDGIVREDHEELREAFRIPLNRHIVRYPLQRHGYAP